MNIKQTLEAIRTAISRCTAPEKELYEELMAEAEGWDMRLREIEVEEEDE